MITVEQLPEAAVDAARLAMAIALANDGDGIPECIAAALSAWPGAFRNDMEEAAGVRRRIILPLPQEASDD